MSTGIPERAGRGAGPAKKGGRWNRFKPFLAPILITCILALGNYEYSILEGHEESALLSGTALAIVAAILAELVLSKLATGRWPHLASCYITGISVGILLRTPLLWPYALCSLLSITSKYALRVRGRHLWNPSNLGVSVLLFVVPAAVAPLSQQWGNEKWVPLIILGLGSLILFSLGRLHITLTYLAAYIVLALVRSTLLALDGPSGNDLGSLWEQVTARWNIELGLLTAPAYLLFMFFMITDPKTTTRTKGRQCAVAVLVAVVECVLRLQREIHAPYYALFIVAPVTNLLEIWWDGRHARKGTADAAPAQAAPARAASAAGPAPQEAPIVADR
jgi:Na+-transporting NADH:ubiquinone oxidoreductase subunit NqrB